MNCAKRWQPLLDVFKDNGQNCCFEVHPGEDISTARPSRCFSSA